MPPNFVLLDTALPDVARLVAAMVQARDAVEHRSWSHPQELTSEEWWADVLADPRARKRERRTDLAVKRAFYRLADEKRETILVACSKCEWRAAFARDDLIAAHGIDYPMPNLLDRLAAPGCSRLGSHWDRCGVHYVEPIDPRRHRESGRSGSTPPSRGSARCHPLRARTPDPRDLMRPFPAQPMRMWPISTRVNKPENDDPSIVESVELATDAA